MIPDERLAIRPAGVLATAETRSFTYCRMCEWVFYSEDTAERYIQASRHSQTHSEAERQLMRVYDMLPEAANAHASRGIYPFADLILHDEVIAACKEA